MANGWIVFNDRLVLGNIGQHNQLPHVLTWGMLAAAYLYALRRLPWWLTGGLFVFLAVLIAWSGGRLPLAYAAAMTVWCWQAPDSVRRSDGSRPVRLVLARRAHLPVSALGVGCLKTLVELTAALPRGWTIAASINVMGGF